FSFRQQLAPVLAVAGSLPIVEADMPRRKSQPAKSDRAAEALMNSLHPHAAGIDLGAREHWVCVPRGSVPERPHGPRREPLPGHVQCFGTCTADLVALVFWLKQARVDTVAMEATGVYWIAVYDLLESEGFRVLLVDPHQIRTAPGRPKTDVKDCMWI